MDTIQYQMQQQSGGSNDSVLAIWTSKMRHALVGQSPKISIKSSSRTDMWALKLLPRNWRLARNPFGTICIKLVSRKSSMYGCHTNWRKGNLLDRIDACDSLLKRNEINPFLKRKVTGDEKWITYENNSRKRSWSNNSEPAQSISKTKKVLLYVWWDWKKIIHYELLPSGQTSSTVNHWPDWSRWSTISGQNWPIGRVLCSIKTTPGRTHL